MESRAKVTKSRWSRPILAGLLGVVLLGFLMFAFLSYGDEDTKECIRVVNQTDDRVVIYLIMAGGAEEVRWGEVRSGSFLETALCGRVALEARLPDGSVVARKPRSESCEEEWIIRGG